MPRATRRVFEIKYAELGLVGQYLLDCRDRGMRPRTILLKLQRLQAMEALMGCPLADAGEPDVRRWWRRLASRHLTNNSRGVYLSHARAFYAWAVLENELPADPTRRIRPPIRRRGMPRGLDPVKVVDLLERLSGAQWYMISLALWCGMRVEEIAQVDPGRDLIDRGEGQWVLHVHGKGGNERVVTVPEHLARALAAAGDGYLFPSKHNPLGRVDAEHVSREGAATLRAGGIAGTMHQLRHTHATALFQRTHDLVLVQQQLGHRSVSSTQIYAQTAGLDPGVLAHLFPTAAVAGAG
jgi:site-specific recombinase XerD